MGLLDDAIREHLELKRRSGADAGELARLERDAFGPVRREEAASDEEPPAPHAEEQAPVLVDEPEREPAPAPAPHAEEEFEDEYVFEDEPEPAAAPLADPQATVAFSIDDLEAAEHHPHAPDPDVPVRHGYDDDDVTAPHPEPGEPETEPEPEIIPADDEPIEHDELEETPEFLQETPEHDRLWFEQKPPRDFDF